MTKIRLHIFDPPSLDKNILDSICQGTHGVIVVFDLANKNSFYDEKFQKIFKYIKDNTEAKVILMANKSDITELEKSEIAMHDINSLMQDFNISDFKITSAKSGYNIENALSNLVDIIIKSKYKEFKDLETIGASIVLKIIILGLKSVGKTSIKNNYLNKSFTDGFIPRIGLDSETKIIEYDFKIREESKESSEILKEELKSSIYKIDSITEGKEIHIEEKDISKLKITDEDEDVRFDASEYDETTIKEQDFEYGKASLIKEEVLNEILKDELAKDEKKLTEEKISFSEDVTDDKQSKIYDRIIEEKKSPISGEEAKSDPSESLKAPELFFKTPPKSASKRESRPEPIVSTTPKPPPPPTTGSTPKVESRSEPIESETPKPPPSPGRGPSIITRKRSSIPITQPDSSPKNEELRGLKEDIQEITEAPKVRASKGKKKKASSKKKSIPEDRDRLVKSKEKERKIMETFDDETEELLEESSLYEFDGDMIGGGLVETKTIMQKKLIRKATVFYKKQMNPMKLNKMTVFLSTSKIYEELKLEFEKIARAATGKELEIEEDESIVRIEPSFPGCVCVPSVGYLDAKKEYDHFNFIISPLSTGEIPEAKVNIFYKDELIDTISTPAKVVSTNITKISAMVTLIIPIFGTLFDEFFSKFFGEILPFYNSVGGLEGILTILTTIMLIMSGISYYFRKPKDAKPAESKSLSDIVSSISD
ncbi:MAG: hypothetical protein KGD63_01620 [Candidatus Lokiarchaeota archaeon]|nr:hypothetical protein [Candidatus Lokiarchaeota archaeon]